MDFFEAVESRHSYRGTFLPGAIPKADVKKILRAGVLSPTGHNAQTPFFIAVTDDAKRGKIAEIAPTAGVKSAPAILFVLSKKQDVPGKIDFEDADYAAATQSMLLAITALGYASVWVDGFLRHEKRAAALAELLQVPTGYTVRVMLPVGVPAEDMTAADKKPFEERVRLI